MYDTVYKNQLAPTYANARAEFEGRQAGGDPGNSLSGGGVPLAFLQDQGVQVGRNTDPQGPNG